MRIGVPKEIKNNEFRVGMTPDMVAELTHRGHEIHVEAGAGLGIGLTDADYASAGAVVATSIDQVFDADMVVKVKEPLPEERKRLRPGQVLFTYLHLAPDLPQTEDLMASGAVCIAYETVTSPTNSLPLLVPMSEVAGRLAPQMGARCLEKAQGGRGILLGGVPGVAPAKVVVLGGGVSGTHAATIAVGMGADVTVLDRSADTLKRLSAQFGNSIRTQFSTRSAIEELSREADLLIGTVLVPGAAAPKLVTAEMVKRMKPGSVIVDVAIDQGGCVETSHATTHAEPTYVVDEVVHYCVANMPGAVARTSAFALGNVTLPFILALADKGWKEALRVDPHLRAGLNVCEGQVTCAPVAEAHNVGHVAAESFL